MSRRQELEIAMHGAKEAMEVAIMWIEKGRIDKAEIFLVRAREYIDEVNMLTARIIDQTIEDLHV